MAITPVVVTINLANVGIEPQDGVITAVSSVPLINDLDGNRLFTRTASARITDGVGSISLIPTDAATDPTDFSYTLTLKARGSTPLRLEGVKLPSSDLTVELGSLVDLDPDTTPATYTGSLANHLADPTDAHDASAISFTPTGTIAATDVQAAVAYVAAGTRPLEQILTTTNLATVEATQTPASWAAVTSIGANDVVVDPRTTAQEIVGVGAAITDAACYNMTTHMTAQQRATLFAEAFDPRTGFNAVRISFGSCDFRHGDPYTYNETTSHVADPTLAGFSITQDETRILPVLREILAVNPSVKVFASVWHPPSWMLADPTKNFTASGPPTSQILPQYLTTYATYLVKAVQAYEAAGVPIYSLNYGNESTPEGTNFLNTYPAHRTVINSLGAQLETAGLETKITMIDGGNFANVAPLIEQVLADPLAASYVEALSTHGYSGQPFAFGKRMARSFPGTPWYSTEWRTLSTDNADKVFRSAVGYTFDSIEGGASGVLFWNFALDESGGPQDGAHPNRRGVVTINSSTGAVTRNSDYYILRHLSRHVQPGARRCRVSSPIGELYAYETYPMDTVKRVAFVNPDGTVVAAVYNGTASPVTLQIVDARTAKATSTTLAAGALSTWHWA